jgi:hypothetical protein
MDHTTNPNLMPSVDGFVLISVLPPHIEPNCALEDVSDVQVNDGFIFLPALSPNRVIDPPDDDHIGDTLGQMYEDYANALEVCLAGFILLCCFLPLHPLLTLCMQEIDFLKDQLRTAHEGKCKLRGDLLSVSLYIIDAS